MSQTASLALSIASTATAFALLLRAAWLDGTRPDDHPSLICWLLFGLAVGSAAGFTLARVAGAA